MAQELQPGDILGPYELEAAIGEGGMGLVFRARRIADGLEVALKVMKHDLGDDLIFRDRFRQEARAAAEVEDPHLVPIVEAGEADGRQYLASGYVTGGSLFDRMQQIFAIQVGDVVRIVADVAAGLDALHRAGVVHRDIKPSNILFGSDGTAMLTDFGLAKGRAYTVLTRPGQVVGTLDYLAPELIRGQPATPATDLYSLGCVAFECVAGRSPFAGMGLFKIGMAHLDEQPADPGVDRPEVPDAFSAAILTALAKEPEQRPASAGAYAALLRDAV